MTTIRLKRIIALLFIMASVVSIAQWVSAQEAQCELPPRMIDNYYGRIVAREGDPVQVWSQPEGSRIVTQLDEGAQFLVVDGPLCLNGVYWWQISDRTVMSADDFRGWLPESDADAYLIEPLFGLIDTRPFSLDALADRIFVWRHQEGYLVSTDSQFTVYADTRAVPDTGVVDVNTAAGFYTLPQPDWTGELIPPVLEGYFSAVWLFARDGTYDVVYANYMPPLEQPEVRLLASLTVDDPTMTLQLDQWAEYGESVFLRHIPVQSRDAYFALEGGGFISVSLDGMVEDWSEGYTGASDQALSRDGRYIATVEQGGQYRLSFVQRGMEQSCFIPNQSMRVGYLRISPETSWLYWSERALAGRYTGFGVVHLGNCAYWRTAETPALLRPVRWVLNTLLILRSEGADGGWFMLNTETGLLSPLEIPSWAVDFVALSSWGEG